MRQLEPEKFLEELSASEKELSKLKEVAFLLSHMPKESPSPSFQADLRERLLTRPPAETDRGKVLNRRERGHRLLRPLFAVAASLLLVFSLVLFSAGKEDFWGKNAAGFDEPSPGIIAQGTGEEQKGERPGEAIVPAEDLGPKDNPSAVDSKGESQERQVQLPGKEGDTPSSGPVSDGDKVIVREGDQGNGAAPEKKTTDPVLTKEKEERLPLEPDPEVNRNLRNPADSFRLAGELRFSPLRFGSGELVVAGVVRYQWEPLLRVEPSAVSSDANVIGTEAWARELLSKKGFVVGEGDGLEIKLQETQRGLFVEVFLNPADARFPGLVFHYREDKGDITGYYYEEKGVVAPAGYYPLLSPSEALEQFKKVVVYAEGDMVRFSFRKVALVYHEFLQEETGGHKLVKLPAYRFTGMEVVHGGSELDVYLPAVRIP